MSSMPAGVSRPMRTTRGRILFTGEQLSARVAWYAPDSRMPAHTHDCHQVSLLLAGTLAERGKGEEVRLGVPAVGVKPAGLAHANDYGPAGALVLGIDLPGDLDLPRAIGLAPDWRWRTRPASPLLGQGGALLSVLAAGASTPDAVESQAWELLAAMAGCADRRGGTPPRWVARACERLQEEAVPLAWLAAEQGVHPVYFARGFARWVGCPPSVFRVRAQLQRGLAQVAAGVPLSAAALHAGFADQAHFSRIARHHCGVAPARLRALLA